jgi:hypothetical protein
MGNTHEGRTSSSKTAHGANAGNAATPQPVEAVANPLLAAGLAWLIPGAGHAFLGRWGRALLFLVLILTFAVLGCTLDGRLYAFDSAQRLLHYVAAVGAFGLGLPYLVLHHAMGYQGAPASATYEYGTAFLITASLLNWLLVLDAWDIARGLKE